MYKNLSPAALGISGRHTELVELCLTHGFQGFDIDINELVRRAEGGGVEFAVRYLDGAPVKIGGWQVPVDLDAADDTYKQQLAAIPLALDVAVAIQADRAFVTVPPTSAEHPFHENFTRIADRLRTLAALLAAKGIRLGVELVASPERRDPTSYQFVQQAEAICQLIDATTSDNVGLVVDTWQWHVGGGTIDRLKAFGGNRIVAVRLCDLPADIDLETITEAQRLMPSETSNLDFPALLSLLREQGYDGPVSIACDASQHAGEKREAVNIKASSALDAQLAAAAPAS